jgi:hypothetical protein
MLSHANICLQAAPRVTVRRAVIARAAVVSAAVGSRYGLGMSQGVPLALLGLLGRGLIQSLARPVSCPLPAPAPCRTRRLC